MDPELTLKELTQVTEVTIEQLEQVIQIGDVLAVQDGEHGILNFLIGHVQVEMLTTQVKHDAILSTSPLAAKKHLKFLSKFTHCIMVSGLKDDVEPAMIIESYYPACRELLLRRKLVPGMTVGLARFKAIGAGPGTVDEDQQAAREAALFDVQAGTPYPIRQLFYFYGREWGWNKTWLMKPVMAYLRRGLPGPADDNYDVCSSSCIKWLKQIKSLISWRTKGCANPDEWYPARILFDRYHFIQIAYYKIIASPKPQG